MITVLWILFTLILLTAGALIFFSIRNSRIMAEMIGTGLEAVRGYFPLTVRDAGEFSEMRMYGIMKFRVQQYDAAELGNVSVMTANMGVMQMCSFMVTPLGRNVPLCTLDFMYILGSRKSYVEFYDLVPDAGTADYRAVLARLSAMQARYADLPEVQTAPAWYDDLLSVAMHKQLKSRQDARNAELFCDALRTWLAAADSAGRSSDADAAQQYRLTKAYSSGLIEKGGVSTDLFKKTQGEEKTREFFDRVFFGTANYDYK